MGDSEAGIGGFKMWQAKLAKELKWTGHSELEFRAESLWWCSAC